MKISIYQICRPLVVGDVKVMQEVCKIARVNLKVSSVKEVKQGKYKYGILIDKKKTSLMEKVSYPNSRINF